ncbi:MAG: VanZ family protein [Chitinophagaceae bacterium]
MNRKAFVNLLGIGFSIFYFLTFFYIVFLARRRRHMTGRYTNLVPFEGTIANYHELNPANSSQVYNFYTNLYGNIILFIPFSIILLWLFRVRNKLKVLFYGFLVSVSIECIQFTLKIGIADIDDVILNTTGALIGVMLYTVFERLSDHSHS